LINQYVSAGGINIVPGASRRASQPEARVIMIASAAIFERFDPVEAGRHGGRRVNRGAASRGGWRPPLRYQFIHDGNRVKYCPGNRAIHNLVRQTKRGP